MLKGKEINRYYVGAGHIADSIMNGNNDPHTCETLQQAVEKAKHKIDDEGCEAAIVVQIVRVVRRKEPVRPPFIVDVLK